MERLLELASGPLSRVIEFLNTSEIKLLGRVSKTYNDTFPQQHEFIINDLVNSVPLVEWIINSGYSDLHSINVAAARKGHINILMHMEDKIRYFQNGTWIAAAKYGWLDILKWLHKTPDPHGKNFALLGKNEGISRINYSDIGYEDEILYLNDDDDIYSTNLEEDVKHNFPISWKIWGDERSLHTVSTAAICGGHIDILKWLCSLGKQLEKEDLLAAAEYGQLDILKWLCESNCPPHKIACQYAAKGGHFYVTSFNRQYTTSFVPRILILI